MCVLGYRYDGAKRTTFGSSFWNNEEQARNSLSRRDVPTSRRRVNHAEVNDVTTSRRHHVATSARKSASHHLMPDGSEIRASGNVRTEARISRARGSRLRESARDLYRFPFFVRYYLGYDDDVFDTRYLVLFIHDVLDLFLGLHQTLSQTMD